MKLMKEKNVNPALNLLSFCVSVTILFQLYVFYCKLSNFLKRKNRKFFILLCSNVCILFIIPFLSFSPLLFNFETPSYVIDVAIYVSQIFFKNICIYLIFEKYKFTYLILLSSCIDVLCLTIPYKELGRLVFICISTSEFSSFMIIAFKIQSIVDFKIMLGLKMLEIINIFDNSNSKQSLMEILAYLFLFEVIKKKVLYRSIKRSFSNEKEFDNEGLSCLDEVYI